MYIFNQNVYLAFKAKFRKGGGIKKLWNFLSVMLFEDDIISV